MQLPPAVGKSSEMHVDARLPVSLPVRAPPGSLSSSVVQAFRSSKFSAVCKDERHVTKRKIPSQRTGSSSMLANQAVGLQRAKQIDILEVGEEISRKTITCEQTHCAMSDRDS